MVTGIKYAVVAPPRTGGTKYQVLLTSTLARNLRCDVRHNGEFLRELNGQGQNGAFRLNALLHTAEHNVVKISPYDLDQYLLNEIEWEEFDSIYLLTRKRVVDRLVSQYIATKTGQWIPCISRVWVPYTEQVTIEDDYVDWFIRGLRWQKIVFDTIRCRTTPSRIVYMDYDTINTLDLKGKVTIYPTGYDYRVLCSNYDYVAQKLNEAGIDGI